MFFPQGRAESADWNHVAGWLISHNHLALCSSLSQAKPQLHLLYIIGNKNINWIRKKIIYEHSENFDNELENFLKTQSEMMNSITDMKSI